MPETPEELHKRAAGSLRMPPVAEWDTFPFEGDLRPRPLLAPLDREPPREGKGGEDCQSCDSADSDYLWTNEHWRLRPLSEPSGLPLVVLLESRAHYAEPSDLPDHLAGELGKLIARIDAAILSIEGIGRVHICRWGDGGEHLHWWFLARPARLGQLLGSFAAIWDDILPPTPREIWDDNLSQLRRHLESVD